MSALSRKFCGRYILFSMKNNLWMKKTTTISCSNNISYNVKNVHNGIWSNPTVIKWMTAYEDLVGLTEVKNVQNKVVEVRDIGCVPE